MRQEYLTRREFNKRVILGGMVAASSAADLANTDAKLVRLQNEAKNEVIERGINPPTNTDEIQKPKEAKVQQDRFNKAAYKVYDEKKDVELSRLRFVGDSAAFFGGLFIVFNAMIKKGPSSRPWIEHKE